MASTHLHGTETPTTHLAAQGEYDSRFASTIHSPRNGSMDLLREKRCFCECCKHGSSSISGESTQLPSSGAATPSYLPFTIYSPAVCYSLLAIATVVGSISGFSTNIFFPAVQDISLDLGITATEVNASITSYIIGQSIAPSVWGPLSDRYGRRVILLVTMALTVAANLCLALSQNSAMLITFRILQAVGSSSAISLGNGILADLFPPAKRGGMQGTFSALRQASQAFGPVIGGLLAGGLGWRSIFWMLLILGAVCFIVIGLFYPETSRKIAGNGSNLPESALYQPWTHHLLPYASKRYQKARPGSDEETIVEASSLKHIKAPKPISWRDFVAPLKIIFWKDCACAFLFGACTYTAWSMMVAVTTYLLKDAYGWSTLQVGLAYIANGSGCMIGALYNGFIELNPAFRAAQEVFAFRSGQSFAAYEAAKNNDAAKKEAIPAAFPLEKARLGSTTLHATLMLFGLIIFGWSLNEVSTGYAHWLVPLLAQFMVGFANSAILNMNQTFAVDVGKGMSAGASATVNLTRGIPAAIGVACVEYLRDALNPGWMSLVLAGLVVLGLIPAILHQRYGQTWRQERMKKQDEASRQMDLREKVSISLARV